MFVHAVYCPVPNKSIVWFNGPHQTSVSGKIVEVILDRIRLFYVDILPFLNPFLMFLVSYNAVKKKKSFFFCIFKRCTFQRKLLFMHAIREYIFFILCL